MSARTTSICPLVLVVLLGACGSDDGTASFVPNADTGGNSVDDTGGAQADTGADTSEPGADTVGTQDTGETTDDTGGEPTAVQGGVTIYEVRAPDVDELNVGGVAAGIQALRADSEDVVATIGACTITSVAPDTNPFPDEPTLDAGAISVTTGGETFALTVTETADGPRYVANVDSGRTEFFADGAPIAFAAVGGADVDAFSGSLNAPADPAVSAPDWEPFGDSHSRDEDLAVSWGGASAGGEIIINILPIEVFPDPGIAEGNAITCVVPDSGGTVIPAAALAYLPDEGGFGGGQSVALTVVRSVSSTVGLGDDLLINATASHTVIGSVE